MDVERLLAIMMLMMKLMKLMMTMMMMMHSLTVTIDSDVDR